MKIRNSTLFILGIAACIIGMVFLTISFFFVKIFPIAIALFVLGGIFVAMGHIGKSNAIKREIIEKEIRERFKPDEEQTSRT